MPRGGRRSGAPGAAYGNRSDLNAPKALAPTAVPSQQYGSQVAQLDAQRALPMSSGPATPAPPAAPVAEQPYSMPTLTPLDAPTARPNEPVTHGLPVGAGAGPEVLMAPQQEYQTGKDFLAAQLSGASSASPEIAFLLAQMQARGL